MTKQTNQHQAIITELQRRASEINVDHTLSFQNSVKKLNDTYQLIQTLEDLVNQLPDLKKQLEQDYLEALANFNRYTQEDNTEVLNSAITI